MPHLTRRFAVLLSLAVGIGPLLLGQSPSVGGEALETLTLALFLVLGFRDVFANPDRKLAFQQLLISLSGLIYICWTLSFIPKLYFCAGRPLARALPCRRDQVWRYRGLRGGHPYRPPGPGQS